MQRMAYHIFVVVILIGIWDFFAYGNLTLIEQLRDQNTQTPVLESTYYDYDVEEVIFTYSEKEPRVDIRWRIDPETIESVDISNRAIWLCSSIARQNLHTLTKLPYYVWFSKDNTMICQQDAVRLVQHGKEHLNEVTGTDVTAYLNEEYKKNAYSIYDVYIYKPTWIKSEDVSLTAYEDPMYQSYIQQWHRVVVFLWTDNERYVLDPLRGEKTIQPQHFSLYLTATEFHWWQRYIPKYGYHAHDSFYTAVSSEFLYTTYYDKHISRVHTHRTPVYYFPSERSQILGVLERWTALEIDEHQGERWKIKHYDGFDWWINESYAAIEMYSFPKDAAMLLQDQIDTFILYLRFLHTRI